MNDQPPPPKRTFKNYWPLFALILVAYLAASAIYFPQPKNIIYLMHYFMGFFLCTFSLLKLFNPRQFADGYQMYDLVAKRSRAYAFCYPFIELGLGLAYLAFFIPWLTYLVTIIIMTISAVGVIQTLRQGLDLRCACMGTVLDVPLSTVTLTEDIGMGLLAFIMMLLTIF